METQTHKSKKKKALYYALWPVYTFVSGFVNTTSGWWEKLLD